MVTLAALRREDEVVFKVVDRGRGIPPEVLERVFDRFESHTAGSRHRGVGLGLSIVRAFMDLHGGEIRINSTPGEGTVVTCIFPGPAKNVAREPSHDSPPPKVFDEIEMKELMREASDGAQAQADRKSIKLRVLPAGDLSLFHGDRAQIRQALTDLLLDAIDSTNSGQAITFAGFQRDREAVFKITTRGGDVDKRRGEARKFVEGSGGAMHVDAVAGEGATVTCSFSLAVHDAETRGGDRAS